MGEHTLGPWTLGPYQEVEHGLVAPAHAYPVMGEFGKVAFVIGSEEEARLIAAAPDLLAALETAFPTADSGAMFVDDEVVKTARAAIAKARQGSETAAP